MRIIILVLVLYSALFPLDAIAALGEKVNNRALARLSSPTNSLKEFVTPDGIVYAVVWKGLRTPDLSKLLGSFYDEFRATSASAPRLGHRQTVTRSQNVVVVNGGHMRAAQGLAYVPALVPNGIQPENLQ